MNCIGILSFFFIVLTYSKVNNVKASLEGEGIVGGTDANPRKYTYMVSLSRGFKHFCGGAIIGHRHIISAAHCVTKNGVLVNDAIQIIAGVNDLHNKYSPTRIEVDVARVYIPKIYSDVKAWNADEKKKPKLRTVGDIAVLLLAEPFDFRSNPNLRKLVLSVPKRTYTGEAVVTGFGWIHVFTKKNREGELEESDGFTFGQLRFAKTNILSYEVCSKLLFDNYESPPDDSHICAQVVQREEGKHEGVCDGDSGGPLVYGDDTLIGVLSTSPIGCHEDVTPAMYTRVSSYFDFIIKAISNVQDPQILTVELFYY